MSSFEFEFGADKIWFCVVDAVINFPQGLTVAWAGKPLGHIAMPNVTLGMFECLFAGIVSIFNLIALLQLRTSAPTST